MGRTLIEWSDRLLAETRRDCPGGYRGCQGSIIRTRKHTAVLEHEGADLLPVHAQRFDRSRPRPDEIPHGLVAFIGNPHRRQLAGA
jgi:hypothetical protein